ncbi:putative PurR-regulated permease PerM [Methanolinea mesophila]|uniref:AI-2E family transporter n=1 Tax=Methanolinea mesophila TaxID=547055 RepID=UPI001AE1F04E|nr:AI-2E family transporter [Methanolinea mesophila]MBP1928697.1 putative PurR-regulated permease PerM [Methanolinea mesophila]
MAPDLPLSEPTRILMFIAGIIIVLAGMKAASPIIAPIAFSVFLAVIFGMLFSWLEKKGLSTRLALLMTLATFFTIIAVFIAVIVGSLFRILAEIPSYQLDLETNLGMAAPYLNAAGFDPAWLSLPSLVRFLATSAGGLAAGFLDLAIVFFVIIFTTVFLILEAGGFSAKIRGVIGTYRPGDVEKFTLLARKNVDYIIVRTEVNLAMGIGTALLLTVIGVEYAIFWGFLAFLLGFIPYVGFWLAVIPPMLLAWFQIGPLAAIAVLAGCAVINTLVEYIMFPQIAGRSLSLSPAVVFISLIFWGFILGGIGVLIAVPLTLAVQMVAELFEETRWIAILLGPSPKDDPGTA